MSQTEVMGDWGEDGQNPELGTVNSQLTNAWINKLELNGAPRTWTSQQHPQAYRQER